MPLLNASDMLAKVDDLLGRKGGPEDPGYCSALSVTVITMEDLDPAERPAFMLLLAERLRARPDDARFKEYALTYREATSPKAHE
jgi:hypothetical protein